MDKEFEERIKNFTGDADDAFSLIYEIKESLFPDQ